MSKLSMQLLLESFNKIDKRRQGSIKLADAIKLIKQTTSTHTCQPQIVDRVIFNTQNYVTFDEFLALLHEAQARGIDDSRCANTNMIDFLRLLQDYRKKCQEQSQYLQAQKAHQKISEIKEKEMRRHRSNLLSLQKSKVISVNSLQQSKLLDFNSAWNEYMEKYEDAAMNSLEKLKAKHLMEMEEEQQRVRTYLQSYLKPSKRVIDLRNKEKVLVKQKQYLQAEKIKNIANQLEMKERESRTVEITERIKKRKETLQKHQQISLLAHLKRIEKDRNEQMKQRQADSEKMLIKLKNIQNDLVQKQSVEIRQTLQNLRSTMCLTSGKMLRQSSVGKDVIEHKIEHNIEHSYEHMANPELKKSKAFKIRVNSLHRNKINESMYDP